MSLEDDLIELATKVHSFTLRPLYRLGIEELQGWHVAIHDPGPPWLISGWSIASTASQAVRMAIDDPCTDRRPPEATQARIRPSETTTSSKPATLVKPTTTKKTWSRK